MHKRLEQPCCSIQLPQKVDFFRHVYSPLGFSARIFPLTVPLPSEETVTQRQPNPREKVMSRFFVITAMVAIVAIVSWGCAGSETTTPDINATTQTDGDAGHGHEDGDHDTTTIYVAATICGECGVDKVDASHYCAVDAEKCESCGLTKGSTLCCVELDESVKGQDLCGKCGNVAESDSCCDENAEKCASCGLAKGSALCCKLKTEE